MAAAAVGEKWQYVRTSYVAEKFPTELPCISFDKIIITINTVVVVVVTDFSDSEHRPRRILNLRIGGYGDRFRLRPDFKMSRWPSRRLFLLLLCDSFNTGGGCGFM